MAAQRTMLVTGGSRGIGRAIALHHAQRGWRVFATGRGAPAAQAADAGIEALALELGDAASVKHCAAEVLQRAGRIDVLVNNAGFDLYGALEDTTIEQFDEQMSVNFHGAVRLIKQVLPAMRAQRGGRIVNIGSIGGLVALPLNSAYAASKFALEGFSESLRLELLPLGIFVSLVEPGSVATDTLDTSIREAGGVAGPYAARRTALVQRMRRDGARSALKPQQVAQAVQRAAEDRHPHLRYAVGAQATWVPRLKAWLPQRVFEAMMRRLFA
jgi:NAD(P)-dependent dehydrogenase (short-subunit alcohol dehydrogenase family)